MRAHARVRAERSGQRKPLSQRRLLTDCHSLLLELLLELPAEQLTCSPRAAMKALRLTMRRTSSSEVAVTVAQRGLPVISASSPQEDPTRMPAGSVRGSGTRGEARGPAAPGPSCRLDEVPSASAISTSQVPALIR